MGCVLAGAGSNASAAQFVDWFGSNVFKHITVTGNRVLGYHMQSIAGDSSAYNSTVYYGQGNQHFSDIGNMTVNGNNVLGVFNFNLQFADNRYNDPTAHRFSLDYNKRGLKLDAGDINASLGGGNRFLNFTRQLYGISGGWSNGSLSVNMLESQSKSNAQTISFAGNGSGGPYYLQSTQIVSDSVRVQVDGTQLTYPDDFTVDSQSGSITFTKRTIASSSTVVASFESIGLNTGGGLIQGGSVAYSLGKFGTIGAVALRQTDPLANGTQTTSNLFQGYGDAAIPYTLEYEPSPSQPITVKVDGLIQSPNIDYYFSTTTPAIFYFRRAIATTSTIEVDYTPKPNASTRGDRSATGFNYAFPIGGKSGSVSFSEATSHLANATNPLSGTAQGVAANYKFKNYTFTTSIDNVPEGFVGIDSTSFQRNERSEQAQIAYHYKNLSYSISQANAAIASQATDTYGNLYFQHARSTSLVGDAKYTIDKTSNWSFSQSHLAGNSVDGPSSSDVSALTYNKALGRLNLNFGLDRTTGSGPISNGITTTPGKVALNTVSLNTNYDAAKGLVFANRTSLSSVDTAGQTGTGKDISLSAAYQPPGGKLTLSSGYEYSNSGEIATLGSFENSSGYGYNGNGFSSGFSDYNSSYSSAGTDLRRWSNTAALTLTKRLSLGAHYTTSSEEGSSSSNAASNAYGMSFDYDLKGNQRCGLAIDLSKTSYIGTTTYSNSTTLDTFVGGKPKGPWAYRLSCAMLLSDGGTLAQNSLRYEFNLRHQLKRNQALVFDVGLGSVTNYQPQSTTNASAGYEYQIWRNMALVGRYQITNVKNLDPTVTTGAYSSHGFDMELRFNFGN